MSCTSYVLLAVLSSGPPFCLLLLYRLLYFGSLIVYITVIVYSVDIGIYLVFGCVPKGLLSRNTTSIDLTILGYPAWHDRQEVL